MPSGKLNESTTGNRELLTRTMFERDIKKGDAPPWYFDRERFFEQTGHKHKVFDLPFNAGSCFVSWDDDNWAFNYN